MTGTVTLSGTQPTPHVRVHRHKQVANKEFSFPGFLELGIDDLEIFVGRQPGGPANQPDLPSLCLSHLNPLCAAAAPHFIQQQPVPRLEDHIQSPQVLFDVPSLGSFGDRHNPFLPDQPGQSHLAG